MFKSQAERAILVMLLVLLAVLFVDSRQKGTVIQQALATSDQGSRAGSLTKAASLEEQGSCARQATSEFSRYNSKDPSASYQNHFSSNMGRCFMVTATFTADNKGVSTSKILADAFEGKVYGSYLWINNQGKKYWEVAPFECKVTMPSGEQKTCKSDDEWEELSKVYMEAR